MIAAVTGATGIAGQFIVRNLLAQGIEVRAWRREFSVLPAFKAAVEWVIGDLGSPQSMNELVAGADMLVHAALEHVPGRYRGGEGDDPGRFIRLNVGGSLDLLTRARDAGVGRAVVLSSRAVFGSSPRPGRIGDDAALAPDTHYGAAKAALEAFVQSWAAEGWAISALRPTGIYGVVEPLPRSKWHDLVAATLRGQGTAEARAGTEVHGEDVATAVWLLLTAPPEQVSGRAFNCSDRVISTRDVVETVHRLTGMEGPLPLEAPQPSNIMACAGLDALGLSFGGRPLFERTVAELVVRLLAD